MNKAHNLAAAGLALALVLLVPLGAAAGPQKSLTVVSWGGSYTRSQMLAYVIPYRAKVGEWVEMKNYSGGLTEIRGQIETANVVWDVVDFELADLIQACREGLLEKIDHTSLPPGEDGTPASDDFIPGAFTECGVGQTVWATVVAYNSERFGAERPVGVADFFDVKKFPGNRGLRRDPRVVMEWALLADGVAPGEVYATLATPKGRERAFKVMDGIKTKIVWWKDGEEPVAMLDSGRVAMTSVWNGRTHRPIAEQGKPFVIVWDGQIWDIDSWGIPKGSHNKDKALDFIQFSTSSGPLAEQAKHITYGPARRSSLALLTQDTKRLLPTAKENMARALQTDAAWWATHKPEMREAFEKWYATGRGLSGTAR